MAPLPPDEALLEELTDRQREQLHGYIDALLEANARFNLTAVRTRDEAWSRHVIECLRLTPALDREAPQTLLDVGSGGGLPGMILAIARPSIEVTLLEATGKKARFLEETGRDLGLSNLKVICARAESAGTPSSPHRDAFDLVTARAVAALKTLLELTVPFAKVGGSIMAIKGQKAEDELADADRALKELRVEYRESERHPTSTLLFFDKKERTPKNYPRRSGEPKKSPL